ncbi:hypothetical protein AVEN_140892-1 [Araneus ventricosus]|uniref:F-box domain-containing protein n=1 Tax=Araneus ventricosus TaxID=182803 RepID=A0A4Y2HVJ2_ARAVE|nr:hypothetical protein AVEN_140892-1 [Araneus ventricosus]
MPLPSLYSICLQRIYGMLMSGTWKTCSTNPFSNLPSHFVDDLLALTRSHSKFKNPPTLADMFLLLTSGKVTRLDLTPFNLQMERNTCAHILRENCFMSVRVLTWLLEDNRSMALAQVFIYFCPNLEEFHSQLRPNLRVFRMCEKLRIIKFCPTPEMLYSDAVLGYGVDYQELSFLRNLEVFYLPNSTKARVAKILQHCPQLISLGLVDSLDGLEKFHTDFSEENLGHLKLRRCVWGKNIENKLLQEREGFVVPEGFPAFVSLYKSQFLEKITTAVSLCPFVEELVVCILNRNSFEELKKLKKLTLLSINLCYCDDDYLPNFMEFLEAIGHQLLHLSVICSRALPVDIIFEHCSNLETLEIDGELTKSRPVPIYLNVSLKRLRITIGNTKTILFLLSSCKCLEEISLSDVSCLDDYLLCQILALNPLRELKVIGISNSGLSRNGFRMILEKAVSLERASFSSFGKEVSCMVQTLIRELNLNKVDYVDFNQIKNDGLFRRKLDVARF